MATFAALHMVCGGLSNPSLSPIRPIHLVKKPVAGAEFSAGAARRPSRAVICCKTAFGYSLDELLSETHVL